ncbi:MAG: PLP-dependent aminotransferase family protein [Alcaligenaceae bacterium]|nr:PLP-dependent aminotransferase family protein [Alcaligenaceae bacterium]
MFEIPLAELVLEKLNRDDKTPLQRQLYQIIHDLINNGKLPPDKKLPSSRFLSKEAGISRITVSLVYERLVTEGYLYSREGSGTYVSKVVTPLVPSGNAPVMKSWVYSERGARLLLSESSPPQPKGEFVPGIPDVSEFPFHIWRKILGKYYSKKYLHLSGYAESGGYVELRKAIAAYLAISRSLQCDPDQVIVTFGTPQSLDLCTRLLSDSGQQAYIEDPPYWATESVFEAGGLKVNCIPLDEEGMALEDGMIAANGKFIYVTPSHQYPTGVTMSMERREKILALAKKHQLWVIEDDYDCEFRHDDLHLPSLQSLDQGHHVIYFGTFSKSMFSGLRLSYMVVPPGLAPAMRRAISNLYLPGMLQLQAALAEFINEGHFYRHIKKMRAIYFERGALFRQRLKAVFGNKVTLSQGNSGLHLMARFNTLLSFEQFSLCARRHGMIVRQVKFHKPTEHGLCLVLGYGGVPTRDIAGAVDRLQQVFIEGERGLFFSGA